MPCRINELEVVSRHFLKSLYVIGRPLSTLKIRLLQRLLSSSENDFDSAIDRTTNVAAKSAYGGFSSVALGSICLISASTSEVVSNAKASYTALENSLVYPIFERAFTTCVSSEIFEFSALCVGSSTTPELYILNVMLLSFPFLLK